MSESVDGPLQLIESSRLVRFLRYVAKVADTQKKRAGQLLLHSRFHTAYLWILGGRKAGFDAVNYARWVSNDETRWPSRQAQQEEAAEWRYQPTVSILLPTFQPNREWLNQAIASVRAQSYEKWQLCIYDDASAELWVREYLQAQAAADARIRVAIGESNAGISATLNAAGKLAVGEYVTFLDHDDVLHPYALHYVVKACQEDAVDVVYSDEDHLDARGARVRLLPDARRGRARVRRRLGDPV